MIPPPSSSASSPGCRSMAGMCRAPAPSRSTAAAAANALKRMIAKARAASAEGRLIAIFPEGTRTAVGARQPYHPGVAALYTQLGLPLVPVAVNSGPLLGPPQLRQEARPHRRRDPAADRTGPRAARGDGGARNADRGDDGPPRRRRRFALGAGRGRPDRFHRSNSLGGRTMVNRCGQPLRLSLWKAVKTHE